MRNKFPGWCYRCKLHVAAGEGHVERVLGAWKMQHAACAIEHRGTAVGRDTEADARQAAILAERQLKVTIEKAAGTGKAASKARKALRQRGIEFNQGKTT